MEVDMTTLGMRALVSLGVTLSVSLAACAGSPARAAVGGDAPAEAAAPLAIRFDNQEREHVHVYLVGEKREWLLGRVEPGAIATLRIPDDLFDSDPGFVQLAVITGGGVSQRAARDPRAQFTIAQDPSGILSHRWQLAQGQLTSLAVRSAH
jgi:hypothetical protein